MRRFVATCWLALALTGCDGLTPARPAARPLVREVAPSPRSPSPSAGDRRTSSRAREVASTRAPIVVAPGPEESAASAELWPAPPREDGVEASVLPEDFTSASESAPAPVLAPVELTRALPPVDLPILEVVMPVSPWPPLLESRGGPPSPPVRSDHLLPELAPTPR